MDQNEAFSLVRRYLEFLREKKYNIVNAYIFGSYAKGDFNEDSDIDIAIILNKMKDRFDMQVELMKLRRKFDLRIEPHPFTKKDLTELNPFIKEVLDTGIEIKE